MTPDALACAANSAATVSADAITAPPKPEHKVTTLSSVKHIIQNAKPGLRVDFNISTFGDAHACPMNYDTFAEKGSV